MAQKRPSPPPARGDDAPIYKIVRRTWLDRLFGWPWNPWRKTKTVRDYHAEFMRPARVKPHATPAMTTGVAAVGGIGGVAAGGRNSWAPPKPLRPSPPPGRVRRESDIPVADNWAPRSFVVADQSPRDVFRSGGGGEFAGGGASGSWEAPDASPSSDSSSSDSSPSSSD